jgi:hypothetical protein
MQNLFRKLNVALMGIDIDRSMYSENNLLLAARRSTEHAANVALLQQCNKACVNFKDH